MTAKQRQVTKPLSCSETCTASSALMHAKAARSVADYYAVYAQTLDKQTSFWTLNCGVKKKFGGNGRSNTRDARRYE